jgi:hypothetical protein
MKKKTYLLMALTMVSMGMNAQNSGKSSVEKGIEKIIVENDEIINSKKKRNEETRRYNLSPRADRALPRC